MQEPKHYQTAVLTESGHDDIPAVVQFTLDESDAREVARLSVLVKSNGLYRAEKFDYSAKYFKHDPEGADAGEVEDGEDDHVSVDCDCINVSDDEFWFSAYLKNSVVEIVSEKQDISELLAHFGLSAQALESNPVRTGEIHKIVVQCGDNIWGECTQFSKAEWRSEVENGDTILGYWEWCYHKAESNGVPLDSLK